MKFIVKLVAACAITSLVACRAPAISEGEGTAESGLVNDIASMTQNPNGTFEVTCKDGHVEHAVTVDGIHSDRVCTPRFPSVICGLYYYSRVSSPDGSNPMANVGVARQYFLTVPEAIGDLGDASVPYRGAFWARPSTTPASSYFTLTLMDRDGITVAETWGEVSIAHLAEHAGAIPASYLTFPVARFEYAGAMYDEVDLYCNVSAARAE